MDATFRNQARIFSSQPKISLDRLFFFMLASVPVFPCRIWLEEKLLFDEFGEFCWYNFVATRKRILLSIKLLNSKSLRQDHVKKRSASKICSTTWIRRSGMWTIFRQLSGYPA
jgi:hypothetical protein